VWQRGNNTVGHVIREI